MSGADTCGPAAPRRGPHDYWGLPSPYRSPTPDEQAALADVYARIETALGPAADACRACGRCCRFKAGGIVLFASALEMANLVASIGLPRPGTCIADGPADSPWCCPYQQGNVCGARDVRPLGCRTYFCDAEAGATGRRLHADALNEIRQIASQHDATWWYGPARTCLATWESCGTGASHRHPGMGR